MRASTQFGFGLLALTLWSSQVATAQVTSVYAQLEFGNTTMVTPAMQAAIQACVALKYASVTGFTVGTGAPPAGATVLEVDLTDTPNGGLLGHSRKRDKSCDVYVTGYTNQAGPPSFNPATAIGRMNLQNALCETAAHELGHLLCATHTQNAPANRKYTQSNGHMRQGNGLPVSTMTVGPLVRSTDDAMDGSSFTPNNLGTIQSAVTRLISGRPNWDLIAAMKCRKEIGMVEGYLGGSLEIDGIPISPFYHKDKVIEVVATASGNSSFDFGWLNAAGDFYDAFPADGSTATFIFAGGDEVIFAVAGTVGSPFEGDVFPLDEYGSVDSVSDPVSAIGSVVPPLAVDYYQTLSLSFDLSSVSEPDIFATLSTFETYGTHGMQPEVCSVSLPAADGTSRGMIILLMTLIGMATVGLALRGGTLDPR